MAIVFQKNVRNGFMNAGTILGLTYAGGYSGALDNAGALLTVCITFWGGTQPTAAALATNWTSTYKSTYLLHLVSANITQASGKIANVGITVANSGLPVAATAFNSGTATWAVIWQVSFPESSIASAASIPASYPKHIISPVSDTAGSYPIRMASTSLTAGTAYSIADFSLTAAGGLS